MLQDELELQEFQALEQQIKRDMGSARPPSTAAAACLAEAPRGPKEAQHTQHAQQGSQHGQQGPQHAQHAQQGAQHVHSTAARESERHAAEAPAHAIPHAPHASHARAGASSNGWEGHSQEVNPLDTSPLAEWGDEPASMHTSHEPASKHASQPTWPHAPAAAGQRQSVHNSTTHTLDNYLGQWGSAVPLSGQPVGEQRAQREQQGPQQGPQDAQYSQHDQYAPQHAQHGQHGSHHAQLPNMGGKSWADSFMDDGEAWGSDTGAQAGLLPLNEPAGQQVSTVLSRAIFLLVFLLIFCEQEYH